MPRIPSITINKNYPWYTHHPSPPTSCVEVSATSWPHGWLRSGSVCEGFYFANESWLRSWCCWQAARSILHGCFNHISGFVFRLRSKTRRYRGGPRTNASTCCICALPSLVSATSLTSSVASRGSWSLMRTPKPRKRNSFPSTLHQGRTQYMKCLDQNSQDGRFSDVKGPSKPSQMLCWEGPTSETGSPSYQHEARQ